MIQKVNGRVSYFSFLFAVFVLIGTSPVHADDDAAKTTPVPAAEMADDDIMAEDEYVPADEEIAEDEEDQESDGF